MNFLLQKFHEFGGRVRRRALFDVWEDVLRRCEQSILVAISQDGRSHDLFAEARNRENKMKGTVHVAGVSEVVESVVLHFLPLWGRINLHVHRLVETRKHCETGLCFGPDVKKSKNFSFKIHLFPLILPYTTTYPSFVFFNWRFLTILPSKNNFSILKKKIRNWTEIRKLSDLLPMI